MVKYVNPTDHINYVLPSTCVKIEYIYRKKYMN